MDAVNDRLERLERSAARWRWAALCMGLVLVAVFAWGAAPAIPTTHDQITTRKLWIVDDDGQVVAAIDAKDSAGRMVLRTADQKTSVSLSTSTAGTAFVSFKTAGGAAGSLAGSKNGSMLSLNWEGKPRVQAMGGNSSGIHVDDADGKTIWTTPSDK